MNTKLFALSVEAFEGEVSGERWNQLEAMLASDPAACAQWQVFMQFHSDLRTLSAISRAERSVQSLVAAGRDLWPDSPNANEVPVRPQLPPRTRFAHLRAAGWLATLAAAVAIALVIHWQSSPQLSNDPIAANLNGHPILAPGPVQLPGGAALYYLPGVGELAVEGPAVLELVDTKRLRLDRGRIRVAVHEPSGLGFEVATSQGVITDLGTEFAVDASEDNAVNLVVFEGAVDLAVPQTEGPASVERFEAGEGIRLSGLGERSRIMQIVAGQVPKFDSSGDLLLGGRPPLLLGIADNLPASDSKRFYEVVSGGMREDVQAYVDRPYEWNGLTEAGLPALLRKATYIKTFNDFKHREFEITLELAGACKVVVLWDERAPYPPWLIDRFEKSETLVGLDEGPFGKKSDPKASELGSGPGESIDRKFSLWIKDVHQPGQVVLGSLHPTPLGVSMYGIAVAP